MQNVRLKKGFSLLELMIAVLIVCVLATLAVSTYQKYVYKSRRADGLQTLYAMQLAEERYRANNSLYGTLAQVWGGVSVSSQGYYDLAISNLGATTYTLTATAKTNQTGDSQNGTSCSTLTVAVSGNNQTQTPAVCFTK